jgi:hypothetical protein
VLNGWQQIADFLGEPISVAQRWAKSGMPITEVGGCRLRGPVFPRLCSLTSKRGTVT